MVNNSLVKVNRNFVVTDFGESSRESYRTHSVKAGAVVEDTCCESIDFVCVTIVINSFVYDTSTSSEISCNILRSSKTY